MVAIAHLLRPRGIRGELAAVSLSDDKNRFASLQRVFVGDAEYHVERTWWHGEKLIFQFRGIDSIEKAEPLAGQDVCVPAQERIQLETGSFFQTDLIGCAVFDHVSGAPVGVVTDWVEYGGTPLLAVRTESGHEALIPFAKSICVKIDVAAKRIEVDLPEGLLDLNAVAPSGRGSETSSDAEPRPEGA